MHYYLKYQCSSCQVKYGNDPVKCHFCGEKQINDIPHEYRSLDA